MSKVPVAFDDIPVVQQPVQWYGGSASNSFDDLSKVSGTMSYGTTGGLVSDNFDDEPPLLEELGINPSLVVKKSLAVLNPLSFDARLLSESDTSGLLLSLLALGFFHLLAGKVQFGDILGFSVMVLCGVYWIINCMAGEEEGGIELGRVSSLFGYCMIPLVLHAAIVVVFPARCLVGWIICAVAIMWSTRVASKTLVAAIPSLYEQSLLVAIPTLLMYAMYALLTVY
uniref:Protein YIP n=1 Tax=Pyramimonas obovata TaxID=1411642 RepID=A0A7S0QWU2_9CHLO|mmetsp:Transcript_23655/g.51628  ORF Transcript_23655/g.51628 Transcript_23655/m.51628 type:complete len:227 (+) Transcript_23655:350-1030(+)|eukprot:CAMPEP_0118924624 /NCGR_PEP_ID=MMETSP1169-20130426/2675_1 /TAXON_ID=36882 /ORGANISM="Pyramimonas obovata, Strain CCMP722" /LENGTH=226 /DNA_ID=CAMNT_0006865753 /DNA_START=283 /DNA_END=963 /DNA_ORIENTATION=+